MSLRIENWGFSTGRDGSLQVGGLSAVELARRFGTPLHVVDEAGLRGRARSIRRAFQAAYPGRVSVHYALKCNSVPAVVQMALTEGLRPEVTTLYEWTLSEHLGVSPPEIIVNGPHKGALLSRAIEARAGLVVIDGFQELVRAEELAAGHGRSPRVLLRVNPDCVPRGMNQSTATGSRRGSVFGFDLSSGEIEQALAWFTQPRRLKFVGLHCHIGTGIRDRRDYVKPLRRLLNCAASAQRYGLSVGVLDIGGGFGVPTSRELTTLEFLRYQATGHLPSPPRPDRFPSHDQFARTVAETIVRGCQHHRLPLPTLVLEPGRSVVSQAGVLLVTVGAIKSRPGVGTWAIADGAAGTVAFPLFYEYHEVFLCRDPHGERRCCYTLVGAACHSADWIYRRKRMPRLRVGDVLAICDAGAYFTVQECNFGFPRPAIVAARDANARVLRRRQTFADMVRLDADGPWHDNRPATASRAEEVSEEISEEVSHAY
jgi:diaminopimelate decarboxylase